MSNESLVDYIEVVSKDRVVFLNDGSIDDDTFTIISSLSETIEEYVSLDVVHDSETAEQFIVAISVHAHEEELYDMDDEDDVCPVSVQSVIKVNGQFLVVLTNSFSDDEDYDDEDDELDGIDDDEWETE